MRLDAPVVWFAQRLSCAPCAGVIKRDPKKVPPPPAAGSPLHHWATWLSEQRAFWSSAAWLRAHCEHWKTSWRSGPQRLRRLAPHEVASVGVPALALPVAVRIPAAQSTSTAGSTAAVARIGPLGTKARLQLSHT